jgi:hypothetical protein
VSGSLLPIGRLQPSQTAAEEILAALFRNLSEFFTQSGFSLQPNRQTSKKFWKHPAPYEKKKQHPHIHPSQRRSHASFLFTACGS